VPAALRFKVSMRVRTASGIADRRRSYYDAQQTIPATDRRRSMLVATFGPSTGWAGKTITHEGGQFVLEDYGPVSAGDVMDYDRSGYLVWANEGVRAWVGGQAKAIQPVPTAQETAPAARSTTATALIVAAAIIVILAVAFWRCASCGGGSDTPDYTMEATELAAAYEENEVSADGTYLDKTVRLTGVVSDIGNLSGPQLELAAGDALPSVLCYCADDQAAAVAGVRVGDEVTVTGVVKGELGWVLLEDCALE
jgi:hypothetical protein